MEPCGIKLSATSSAWTTKDYCDNKMSPIVQAVKLVATGKMYYGIFSWHYMKSEGKGFKWIVPRFQVIAKVA